MNEVRVASVIWSILSILFGWSVFGYWWLVVLDRTEASAVLFAIALVVLITDALVLAATGWITHNRRLARHGTRGRATPYRMPQFHRDGVNRQLILPSREALRHSPLVAITATAQEKIYTALPASPLP